MKLKKIFCSIDHMWDMKWTESKAKIIIEAPRKLIKFLCLLMMIKTIIVKDGWSRLSHFHKSTG